MDKLDFIINRLFTIFCVVIGNACYALSVKLFLLPSGLITGGTTGLGLVAHHLTGVSISAFVLCFNIIMLLIGFACLGRKFAMTTLASTFLYPAFLELFNRLLGDLVITDDLFLCTAFTGLGIGLALGMVIRAGASTGGMDIPPLVIRKYFNISVSVTMYIFDVCILLAQAVFQPADRLLYGIILVLIYTVVLDKMMMIGKHRTEIKVISTHTDEIRQAILSELDRGVTLLNGQGGYEGKEIQMILSIISNREIGRIEKIVHNIDPECFMIVSRVSEVRGRGFSLRKVYGDQQ